MTIETAQYRRSELPGSDLIFGCTAGMREVKGQLERALHDDLPVLIEGESGTGKEVIGRFLHKHSRGRGGPFVKLNCAAIPANLVEAEFEARGGAGVPEDGGPQGEAGSAGTLFLDEIGDLDLGLQRKLALGLKSRDFRHAGDSSRQQMSSARLVCATSADLKEGSANEVFADELLGCFSEHRLILLPLRERKEDIPQLCDYLLGKLAREFGRPVPRLSPYVLHALQQWKWPGNIRELENWIARIVIFGTEEAIGLDFNRQLLAWGEELPRLHRAVHAKVVRTRQLRRRS